MKIWHLATPNASAHSIAPIEIGDRIRQQGGQMLRQKSPKMKPNSIQFVKFISALFM
jgi:hypothetical protein